jgi:hypothetical protein
VLTIFIVTCFSRPCFSSSESTVLLLSCTAWFESMVCSWEPTLAVVEGSQDPACKRFPDWNGPDRGEPGESSGVLHSADSLCSFVAHALDLS